MMNLRTSVIAMLLAVTLGGCAGMTPRQQDTAIGAAIGGVGGYAITGGSALGTVGGAAVGGVIGNQWRYLRD